MQDENKEIINIYLKIFYRNYNKKSIYFREPIYSPVWTDQLILLILIDLGFEVLSNSIKIRDSI